MIGQACLQLECCSLLTGINLERKVVHTIFSVTNVTVRSDEFGHQVNSDTCLQTVEIQMRRLLMSRLKRIFTVCLVNLFFIPIIEQ